MAVGLCHVVCIKLPSVMKGSSVSVCGMAWRGVAALKHGHVCNVWRLDMCSSFLLAIMDKYVCAVAYLYFQYVSWHGHRSSNAWHSLPISTGGGNY